VTLVVCKKCRADIPDNSIYCCACGKKQQQPSRPQRHRPRAHSEGSIVKLSGKRRCPYWARGPAIYTESGVTRPSLGCFSTYKEAAEALGRAKYTPTTSLSENTTLSDIYNCFIASHYFSALTTSAQNSHKGAWKHLVSSSNTPVSSVNKETFQHTIDELIRRGLKRGTLEKVRNLSSLLCKEAMGRGLLTINYGQLVQLPKADKSPVLPFSSSELKKLWTSADAGDSRAQAVLLLCYTGMRPGEMLSARIEKHLHIIGTHWYLQTGSKTDAGRNRIIPIPPIIHPIVTELIDNRPEGPIVSAEKGGHYRLDNWRPRCFNTLMKELEIKDHVPYSARHTYADLQKRRQIDPAIMMEIMGHEDYSTTVEHYQTTTEEDITRICAAVAGLERPS